MCKITGRTWSSAIVDNIKISYEFQNKNKFQYIISGLSGLLLYSNVFEGNDNDFFHYLTYLVKWISASYRKGIDKLIWLSCSCSSLLSLFNKTHLSQVLQYYFEQILY